MAQQRIRSTRHLPFWKRRHANAAQTFACVFVFLIAASSPLGAQQNSGKQLADYVGTYADFPGHTLQIVVGDTLFAVVDEAKYPLRPSGADQFSTITGQIVSFPRDAKGVVTGYTQDGHFHPRVSTTITPEAAALAHPRPKGKDSSADYQYHPPADLHDGIAIGDIAESDLGVSTANAIVREILSGTYLDVHSVLLYQHGKLVLEEYFYIIQGNVCTSFAPKDKVNRLGSREESRSTGARSPDQMNQSCRI